jgi:hypothetical protein
MPLLDLCERVAAGLREKPYMLMDADGYYRYLGKGREFNRDSGNATATQVIRANACRLATVETFIRMDGEQQILTFMVFAISQEAWDVARVALEQQVERMLKEPCVFDPFYITHQHPVAPH